MDPMPRLFRLLRPSLPASELRLDLTLRSGQAFRWRALPEEEWPLPQACTLLRWDPRTSSFLQEQERDGTLSLAECAFVGVLGQRVVRLFQTSDDVLWEREGEGEVEEEEAADMRVVLMDYFRLGVEDGCSLEALYASWSAADPQHFARVAERFPGVRLLRQDPFECLLSFICSSNNNIKRIASMVDAFCAAFGAPLPGQGSSTHAFPGPQELLARLLEGEGEDELRAMGFGYRAKFVVGALRQLQLLAEDPPADLVPLERPAEQHPIQHLLERMRRHPDPELVLRVLEQLPGVGRKVASCVALMSLDKLMEIPVDTHVWQMAQSLYGFPGEGKSLTERRMREVRAVFVDRFGERAGWAQAVLFVAHLGDFRDRVGHIREMAPPPRKRDSRVKGEGEVKEEKEKEEPQRKRGKVQQQGASSSRRKVKP